MEYWDAYDGNFRQIEGVSLVRGRISRREFITWSAMCWYGTRTGAIF